MIVQRGLEANSNNSLAGNCLSLGETEAQARGRNLLFSSFQCVSSISWTVKLRNGKKHKNSFPCILRLQD